MPKLYKNHHLATLEDCTGLCTGVGGTPGILSRDMEIKKDVSGFVRS